MVEDFPMIDKKRRLALPADFMGSLCGKTQRSEKLEFVDRIMGFLKNIELGSQRGSHLLNPGFIDYMLNGGFDLIHYVSPYKLESLEAAPNLNDHLNASTEMIVPITTTQRISTFNSKATNAAPARIRRRISHWTLPAKRNVTVGRSPTNEHKIPPMTLLK